jgi:uncharacterized protein YoxC
MPYIHEEQVMERKGRRASDKHPWILKWDWLGALVAIAIFVIGIITQWGAISQKIDDLGAKITDHSVQINNITQKQAASDARMVGVEHDVHSIKETTERIDRKLGN